MFVAPSACSSLRALPLGFRGFAFTPAAFLSTYRIVCFRATPALEASCGAQILITGTAKLLRNFGVVIAGSTLHSSTTLQYDQGMVCI